MGKNNKKTFKTTITQKGQMTIPKKVREELDLQTNLSAQIEFNEKDKSLKIKQGPDIMNLKAFIKPPTGKDALKAREEMENNYERV